jgi:hypothetical protein
MNKEIIDSSHSLSAHGRVAILLLFIGILYAVDMLAGWSVVTKLWPLLVIMLGTGLIGIYLHRDRRSAIFLASGIYLLCFAFLAFYFNFTSWSNIVYLWPLFIAFLGVSRRHRRVAMLTGLLFISCALVFFFVFTIDSGYWWIVFVLAGLSVLAAERAE